MSSAAAFIFEHWTVLAWAVAVVAAIAAVILAVWAPEAAIGILRWCLGHPAVVLALGVAVAAFAGWLWVEGLLADNAKLRADAEGLRASLEACGDREREVRKANAGLARTNDNMRASVLALQAESIKRMQDSIAALKAAEAAQEQREAAAAALAQLKLSGTNCERQGAIINEVWRE